MEIGVGRLSRGNNAEEDDSCCIKGVRKGLEILIRMIEIVNAACCITENDC